LYVSFNNETHNTWPFFPQFGGGRNIQPGEALETPQDRAAKEARTKQLLASYKQKIGLKMDPKLKAECEEVCLEMPHRTLKQVLAFVAQ